MQSLTARRRSPHTPELSTSKPSYAPSTPSTFGHSRAERFKPLSRTSTPDFLTPISSLSKRTCTFGFGTRYELKCLTGRDSPSPCTYNLPNCFDKEKPGPIMIRNSTNPKRFKEDVPGPGSYNPHSELGKDAKKFSFKGRINREIRNDSPPPDAYNPCFTLVTRGNFKEITFGIGERAKVRKNECPGPGTYELPSIFHSDRLTNLKENFKSVNKK